MMIANMASGQISIRLGAKGPNSAPVTACATGTHAIGDAFKILQRGDADVMIGRRYRGQHFANGFCRILSRSRFVHS